jgi:hypothetical protein
MHDSIDELMEVATANNDMMHGIVREIVEAMNGLYQQGPVKKLERVQEKSDNDYKIGPAGSKIHAVAEELYMDSLPLRPDKVTIPTQPSELAVLIN